MGRRQQPRYFRPEIEELEDRCVLSPADPTAALVSTVGNPGTSTAANAGLAMNPTTNPGTNNGLTTSSSSPFLSQAAQFPGQTSLSSVLNPSQSPSGSALTEATFPSGQTLATPSAVAFTILTGPQATGVGVFAGNALAGFPAQVNQSVPTQPPEFLPTQGGAGTGTVSPAVTTLPASSPSAQQNPVNFLSPARNASVFPQPGINQSYLETISQFSSAFSSATKDPYNGFDLNTPPLRLRAPHFFG